MVKFSFAVTNICKEDIVYRRLMHTSTYKINATIYTKFLLKIMIIYNQVLS